MATAKLDNKMQKAILQHHTGKFAEAERLYRQIHAEHPDHADVLHLLGVLCTQAGRTPEAVEFFAQAVAIDPNVAEYYKSLAAALTANGQIDEAVTALKKAIEIKSDDAEAHYRVAINLLLRGEFQRGGAEFEWRLRVPGIGAVRHFTQPHWDGKDPRNKTILLYAEKDPADSIQYIRYAPLLARREAKVIVECQPELVKLFQKVEGVSKVVAAGDPLPEFDIHQCLVSLPLAFSTTLGSIPSHTPYLSASADAAARWSKKVIPDQDHLRIGLVWADEQANGPESADGITFDQLCEFASIKNVKFISLQKGKAGEVAASDPAAEDWLDLTSTTTDLNDLAGLISTLDRVITIDNTIAHLAGAMGKPVWLLLPSVPHWRWMLNRSDSPWYPDMRLFRQPKAGDWKTPIAQIAADLRPHIETE